MHALTPMAATEERDFSRGFLPPEDPLPRLPAQFDPWEDVAAELSQLVLSPLLRPRIYRLPPFPLDELNTLPQYWRAMTLLSHMASLYIWAPDQKPISILPRHLSQALYAVSRHVGTPPILTYASQAIYNWRRLDPNGPIIVGNLALLQNFLGGMDEEWFVTIHISIEAVAGRALTAMLPAQKAVKDDSPEQLSYFLNEIAATLPEMEKIFLRMPQRCDPYIYYHRVRPFMFGWMGQARIPEGVTYQGVAAYGERPQQFRGETGAQSGIIPAIDAVLGVDHEMDEMRAYLLEMRDYMPGQDRAVIERLELGPSVRDYVTERLETYPTLRGAYNLALEALHSFRKLHVAFAAEYVLKPAQGQKEGQVGTGGTNFTVYLKKHLRETEAHYL